MKAVRAGAGSRGLERASSDGGRSRWGFQTDGRGVARWPFSRPGVGSSPGSACRGDKSVGHRLSCLSPFPSLGGRGAREGRATRIGVQGASRRGPASRRLGWRRGSHVRPVARGDRPRQRRHAEPAGLVQPRPDTPAAEAHFGDTCRPMLRGGHIAWPAAVSEDWTCPVDFSPPGALGPASPMGQRTRPDGKSRRRPDGRERPRRPADWGIGRYDQGVDDDGD
jgi:hypothetical protein